MFFVTWHPDSPPVTRWSDKFYPSAQYGLSSDDDLFKLSKLTNTRNHQVAGDTWPYAQWLRIVVRPRTVPRPPTYLVAPVAFQVRLPTTIKCMNTTLCARVWAAPFLDREQQPMNLPPFADKIAGQLLH